MALDPKHQNIANLCADLATEEQTAEATLRVVRRSQKMLQDLCRHPHCDESAAQVTICLVCKKDQWP